MFGSGMVWRLDEGWCREQKVRLGSQVLWVGTIR